MSGAREEYGDWQTPYELARDICLMLKKKGIAPMTIVEPACGRGSFIRAALDVFGTVESVYAIEINPSYIETVRQLAREYTAEFYIYCQSVFDFDFSTVSGDRILMLGNPPWVTNSRIGAIGGGNLPAKSNFKRQRGIEALTGKGNFDISESIMLSLFSSFAHSGADFAFLLKDSVIRSLVYSDTAAAAGADFSQYSIDAKKEFGASASASLLAGRLGCEAARRECRVYDFYSGKYSRTFAMVGGVQVSDIEAYRKSRAVDGTCQFIWRSGIKHDCAKIMELRRGAGGCYTNGLGQSLVIESDLVYPLAKSSDLQKACVSAEKFVLIPQRKVSEDTSAIERIYPLTYGYLLSNSLYFEKRKSVIYRNKPKFCIFGVGDYSFLPYKVAVSSLYRSTAFSLLEPAGGKPIMVDDTCYSIGFESKSAAALTLRILNSHVVQAFIKAVSPSDSKRVITKDILMRIDIAMALQQLTDEELEITPLQRAEYMHSLRKATHDVPSLFSFA